MPAQFDQAEQKIGMIPKRIIQFWHATETIPDSVGLAVENTRKIHHDYTCILADDEFMHRHIASYYDAATLALYKKIKISAARSDLARLMLLHHYGGTYVDCSFQLNHRLDTILREDDEIVLVRRDDNRNYREMPERAHIINGFISAPPGSGFIHWCILRVLANLVDGDYNNKVVAATGPLVINMGLNKLADKYKFRFLGFASLKQDFLTNRKKRGQADNWLATQDDGIIDRQYLQSNGMRAEKLWRIGPCIFHFSASCMKLKN